MALRSDQPSSCLSSSGLRYQKMLLVLHRSVRLEAATQRLEDIDVARLSFLRALFELGVLGAFPWSVPPLAEPCCSSWRWVNQISQLQSRSLCHRISVRKPSRPFPYTHIVNYKKLSSGSEGGRVL